MLNQTLTEPSIQTGPLGNVVVLHGIMGGELTLLNNDGQELIWVNILRLIEGQFNRLALDENDLSNRDIRPSGIYMRYYGSQLASLSRQWNVRPFFFDWRRDIRLAARDLRLAIDSFFGPGEPVHLVAHSMGGLVARAYIAAHPDRWAKGGRLVMLGTPNFGAFAVPRFLFGTNDILKILKILDQVNDGAALLNIAKTFVGMYQMMPARHKLDGLDVLYQAGTYTATQVSQHLLDQVEQFQSEISGAIDPDRMIYIAGYNRPTPAAIVDPGRLGSDAGYVLSLRGDGTVPHDLGLIDGVKTFYVDEQHMSLPANAHVRVAMTELLQTGGLNDEQFLKSSLPSELKAVPQTELLSQETDRLALKQQQAITLRDLLAKQASPSYRCSLNAALVDLLLMHDPLPGTGPSPLPLQALRYQDQSP